MAKTHTEQFQRFITLLFETSQVAARHGDMVCQRFGQSSARWRVLRSISKGSDTVSAAAKATSVSRQATQRIADELAADGLIAYSSHRDHRTQTVTLTPQGGTVVQQMSRSFSLYAEKLSAEIPPQTLLKAIETLETIRKVIDKDTNEIQARG